MRSRSPPVPLQTTGPCRQQTTGLCRQLGPADNWALNKCDERRLFPRTTRHPSPPPPNHKLGKSKIRKSSFTVFPFTSGCALCPFTSGCALCPFTSGCALCPVTSGCALCPFTSAVRCFPPSPHASAGTRHAAPVRAADDGGAGLSKAGGGEATVGDVMGPGRSGLSGKGARSRLRSAPSACCLPSVPLQVQSAEPTWAGSPLGVGLNTSYTFLPHSLSRYQVLD